MSSLALVACDGGSEAQRRGIGASCSNNDECSEVGQRCLDFKGGYCGIMGCSANTCPSGSLCVTADDNNNYCFLVCATKEDCNRDRSAGVEANCSSDITSVDETNEKACVPPSGN